MLTALRLPCQPVRAAACSRFVSYRAPATEPNGLLNKRAGDILRPVLSFPCLKAAIRGLRTRARPTPRQQAVVATRQDTSLLEPLEWDAEPLQSPAELFLPPPTNTKVKTADFVKSSTAISQCPTSRHPEFAIIGRSNVGKSSLINMLTGRKALAQISKTPGAVISLEMLSEIRLLS